MRPFANWLWKFDLLVCTVCAVNIMHQRNKVGHVLINHFKGTLQICHVSFKFRDIENVRLAGYELYTRWMQLSLTSAWGCREPIQKKHHCRYSLLFVGFLHPSYSISDMHTHIHTHTVQHTVQHTVDSCLGCLCRKSIHCCLSLDINLNCTLFKSWTL